MGLLCILARKSRSQLLHASTGKCMNENDEACYCCSVLRGDISTYFVEHFKLIELLSLKEIMAGVEQTQQVHNEYLKAIQIYLKIPLSQSVRKICTLSFLAKVKFATAFI